MYSTDEDDFVSQLDAGRLSRQKRQITCTLDNASIQVTPLMEITGEETISIGINTYRPSKPSFSFPQGCSLYSNVYKLKMSTSDQYLRDRAKIQFKFQKPCSGKSFHILQASCTPTHWEANLTPVFKFSLIDAQNIQQQDALISATLNISNCYVVLAGISTVNTCSAIYYSIFTLQIYHNKQQLSYQSFMGRYLGHICWKERAAQVSTNRKTCG